MYLGSYSDPPVSTPSILSSVMFARDNLDEPSMNVLAWRMLRLSITSWNLWIILAFSVTSRKDGMILIILF